jgi:hypothetical protein
VVGVASEVGRKVTVWIFDNLNVAVEKCCGRSIQFLSRLQAQVGVSILVVVVKVRAMKELVQR